MLSQQQSRSETPPINLVAELGRGQSLTPLRNTVLESLIEGFQKDFPVQSALLFIHQGPDVILHMVSSQPQHEELQLPKGSFIHQRASHYEGHSYTALRFYPFHPSASYLQTTELKGVESIFEYLGLKHDNVSGVADFAFAIGGVAVIGLLVNPLSPETGALTREVVRFSDKDRDRLEEFLAPFRNRARDIEHAILATAMDLAEKEHGFPGLTETPSLEECEAYSFLEQKVGTFGGDFLHPPTIQDGKALYFLGDVSGKSIGASGLNACLRYSLEALTLHNIPELNTLMKDLNLITLEYQGDDFATGFVFTIDRSGTLAYSSAGHQAYILRKDGSNHKLEVSGLPLGILGEEQEQYQVLEASLSPGDSVIVWSDGYSEITNKDGELLRDDRVLEYLNEYRGGSVQEMGWNLEQRAAAFSSDEPSLPHLPDDRTVLLVRYKGPIG